MLTLVFWVLAIGLAASFLSMAGGLFLLVHQRRARRWSLGLISFAAGALLGVAFLDVIPEALAETSQTGSTITPQRVLMAVLLGLLVFFIIERLFLWFHHHEEALTEKHLHPEALLIIYGDAVHNLIDGIVIGIAFLTAVPLGIATALAIVAHEIPQEVGDFGVLLQAGYSNAKNLAVNLAASLTTPIGALLTLVFSATLTQYLPYLLGFAGGIFIYIAASDLIPKIHRHPAADKILQQIAVMLLGVMTIWLMGKIVV